MTWRQRLATGATLLLVILFCFFQILFKPLQQYKSQLRKTLSNLQQQWQQRQAQQRESIYYQTQLQQLRDHSREILPLLAPVKLATIIDKITNLAQQQHLKILQLSTPTFASPLIKLQLRGNFVELMLFLSFLQTAPGLCTVPSLQINSQLAIQLHLECHV